METTNDSTQLRESIRLLERKLCTLNESEMSCCGITLAQCHSIVEIGRAGNISLIDLARLLNLDNSTISRTVNNLVNAGLVTRELNPEDRRYVTIQLTEAGKKIFDDIEKNMNSKFKKLFEKIPEGNRAQVLEGLKILIETSDNGNCC